MYNAEKYAFYNYKKSRGGSWLESMNFAKAFFGSVCMGKANRNPLVQNQFPHLGEFSKLGRYGKFYLRFQTFEEKKKSDFARFQATARCLFS